MDSSTWDCAVQSQVVSTAYAATIGRFGTSFHKQCGRVINLHGGELDGIQLPSVCDRSRPVKYVGPVGSLAITVPMSEEAGRNYFSTSLWHST